MKKQIAAIDFGTYKIVTLIAASSGMDRSEILGSGTVPYDGYSEGEWNAPDQLLQCVRESIAAAELESKSKIEEIYVGVPGEYIRACSGEAEIELDGATVTEEHTNAVLDCIADRLQIEREGGMVLHRSPAWFSIDDGKRSMTPTGLTGDTLKASATFIVASSDFIQDIVEIMGELNISIAGFLSSTLGEAMLLLKSEDRDRTAMLIDVGYLNTEVSVVEGDAIVFHGLSLWGGGDITAELARTLQIPMAVAEEIKRKYVFNPDEFEMEEFVEATDDNGKRMRIERKKVADCVERVVDSLCEDVDMMIRNSASNYLGSRSQIFVTGGGIVMMQGGRDYLASKLGRAIKVPVTKSSKLNSPVYASIQGLVNLIFDAIEPRETAVEAAFSTKLINRFRRR